MKKIALIGVFLLTCNLFAYDNYQGNMDGNHHDRKNDNRFQEAKEKMLKRENQHLRMVQSNIDCTKRANSMQDLKMCREQAQEKREQMKSQFSKDKMDNNEPKR